jgi:EmrB/QacA subfamily drug resistance transporter
MRPGEARLGPLLVLMCVALALVMGGGSSLNVALPDIAADLGATQTDLAYVVNVYALTFAALLLPVGFAADRFGRRAFLVAGLLIYGAATLASGFVGTTEALIALRALAGVGAAAVMPATLSVLVEAYPPERRSFAVSIWAGVSGGGAILGVVLSGVLLTFYWWGSVQVLYGGAALVVALVSLTLVPPSRTPGLTLDPPGGLLALVGLSGLVLGLIEGPERGWTAPLTLVALGAGIVGLAAFVWWEARARAPMLDVRLFRRPALAAGSILIFLQFFAAFRLFYLLPQFFQFVQGAEPLEAALKLLPMGLGIAPASALGPQMLQRLGTRATGAGGLLLMAVAFLLFGLAGDAPYWQLGPVIVVFGFGLGLSITPGTQLIIDGLPADRRTLSAAVNDVTREVGGVLGGAVAASVLVAVYGRDLVTTGLPPQAAEAAEEGVGAALAIAGSLGPQGAELVASARDAFTAGYSVVMLVATAALVLGAVLTALLAPGRPETGPRTGAVADDLIPTEGSLAR